MKPKKKKNDSVRGRRKWSECNPDETNENPILETNQNLNPNSWNLEKELQTNRNCLSLEHEGDRIYAAIALDTVEIIIAGMTKNAEHAM